MAIRHLLLLFSILCFAGSSLARKASVEEREAFKNAKIAYKKGLYDTSLNILRSRYNFRRMSTPSGALELAALANEKLGYHKDALVIYTVLIKKKYPQKNQEIISSYRADGNAEDIEGIDEKLSFYYYKKAYNTKALYDESNNELFYKAAQMYTAICIAAEHHEDEAEELFEAVGERKNEYQRLVYKQSKNLLVSYITWQDKLTLVSPSGTKQDIGSSAEGTCLGGGFEYANAYINYKMDACIAFASATVGEDTKEIDYFQSNVTERALFLFPGVRWKPKAGSVSFGMSVPFVYRVGDFTEPDGFTIEGKSQMGLGLMVESGWMYKSFGVDLKLGRIFGFSSTTMSFGVNYIF
ncbi:hypothetical protein [Halobacteriovorax sp. HLS]|uniref:hypothetical protein n=1 Tax=Halobacteriovorax sp. HLS TaxID=2234000 RepID=UPI000FDAB551|nr:hypothetical protein [Halobacteriovorax sp. HLS]